MTKGTKAMKQYNLKNNDFKKRQIGPPYYFLKKTAENENLTT